MNRLTHLDETGAARMVDVGGKHATARSATAEGRIRMNAAALDALTGPDNPKGDALATARIAGIMAAKKTGELIPLCHPLALSKVAIEFELDEAASAVTCRATVQTVGPTGVEMEALTAVQVGLLTIYDMCKAAEKGMVITDVRLLEKQGGKSGHWQAA